MKSKRIGRDLICLSALLIMGVLPYLMKTTMDWGNPTVQMLSLEATFTPIAHTQTFFDTIEPKTTFTKGLTITNLAAPGTRIPEDLYFQIQVRLGDVPLPVGSSYKVDEERRTVDTAGILFLRIGETAVIEYEILPGTHCYVTELSSSLDGYRAAYSGTDQSNSNIKCTEDGAFGIFPASGFIHFTIINANYDFSLQIPIPRTAPNWQREATFSYRIEHVEQKGDEWRVVETLPEMQITETDSDITEGILTIGFRAEDEGVFYYRITEVSEEGNCIHDSPVILVKATVGNGSAKVAAIRNHGNKEQTIMFPDRYDINRFNR